MRTVAALLLSVPSVLQAQEALCTADGTLRVATPVDLQTSWNETLVQLTLAAEEPRTAMGVCRDVAGGLACRLGGSGTLFQVIDRGEGPVLEVGPPGIDFRTEADQVVWGPDGRADRLVACR